MILEYLYKYNSNELFYRNCYEAKKDPEKYRIFISHIDPKMIIDHKIILPDVFAESLPPSDYWIDENFFGKLNHVKLIKHDRYTPAFPHSHNFFEMTYVLSGLCIQHFQSEEVTLKTGDICFIALNTEHTIEVNSDSIVLNILIRHNTFEDIFLNTLRNKSILTTFFLNNLYANYRTSHIIFQTMDDERIRNQILDMYIEQFESDEYCDNILVHMLSIFFNQLLRFYAKSSRISNIGERRVQEQIDIISYIQANYQTATLKGTAEHFNYTVPYCSRLIKQLTGNNFTKLLREIRLQQAEIFLRATNISIENLALHLGYENSETLIRIFKKNRNMTPSQYRNNNAYLR